MLPSSRPDLPAFLAYLKRVEQARKLVAEFDEWLASGPPTSERRSPGGTDGRRVTGHVGDYRGPGRTRRRNPPP